jgi:hypothetical protein
MLPRKPVVGTIQAEIMAIHNRIANLDFARGGLLKLRSMSNGPERTRLENALEINQRAVDVLRRQLQREITRLKRERARSYVDTANSSYSSVFALWRERVNEPAIRRGQGVRRSLKRNTLGSDFVRLCHAQSVLNPLERYTSFSEGGGNRNFPRRLERRVSCGLGGICRPQRGSDAGAPSSV